MIKYIDNFTNKYKLVSSGTKCQEGTSGEEMIQFMLCQFNNITTVQNQTNTNISDDKNITETKWNFIQKDPDYN